MTITRKSESSDSKVSIDSLSPEAITLTRAIQRKVVLGVATCHNNTSGCYDAGEDLCYPNVPLVRVIFSPSKFVLRDQPPKRSFEYIFFTGCFMSNRQILDVINVLASSYQMKNIKYVYKIPLPHHMHEERIRQLVNKLPFDESDFLKKGFHFRFLMSSFACKEPYFSYNIGIPRFQLKSSEFIVPEDCYGLLRNSDLPELPFSRYPSDIQHYLNTFFLQVARAGKECNTKPMAIIIGIPPSSNREEIIKIANKHSVNVDFCDQYPNNRLPFKEDFLKVLNVLKQRQGIVSFANHSTQCLFQALSIGTPVLICSPLKFRESIAEFYEKLQSDKKFYQQLLHSVSEELHPTARVILGISCEYQLLDKRGNCQEVYLQLQTATQKLHARNFVFKYWGFLQSAQQFIIRHFDRTEMVPFFVPRNIPLRDLSLFTSGTETSDEVQKRTQCKSTSTFLLTESIPLRELGLFSSPTETSDETQKRIQKGSQQLESLHLR